MFVSTKRSAKVCEIKINFMKSHLLEKKRQRQEGQTTWGTCSSDGNAIKDILTKLLDYYLLMFYLNLDHKNILIYSKLR